MAASLEPALVGLIDDAAIFPPGDADLHAASAAFVARGSEPWADLVGTFVVRDLDIPQLRGTPARLSIVVTGGAGQIGGPAGLCAKLGLELAGLEIALRDLDDLAGNAQRVVVAVDAARADGVLDDDVPVYVELPAVGTTASWLAAADEVASAELRFKFRTGGLEAAAFPAARTLGGLDRCRARPRDAVQVHGRAASRGPAHERRGLRAPRLPQCPWSPPTAPSKAPATDEVVATLEERDGTALAAADWSGARRWFASFGSCSIDEPLADLRELGLIAP